MNLILKPFHKTKIIFTLFTIVTVLMISSCSINSDQIQQDSLLELQKSPPHCFKQSTGNRLHPAEYFTCDCNQRKTRHNQ